MNKNDCINLRKPLLVRRSKIKCTTEYCKNSVSVGSHTICSDCAFIERTTEEFNYHEKNTYMKCNGCNEIKNYDPTPECFDCSDKK